MWTELMEFASRAVLDADKWFTLADEQLNEMLRAGSWNAKLILVSV